MQSARTFGVVLAMWLAAATLAVAQVDTGSIDGRILDEQGAATPGVTVTAKNNGTGLTRTSVTSQSGTYHIGSLPSGAYTVTAELASFATQVHKDVIVQVGQATTVDVAMKLGGVTESVTVNAETPLVQTTTSDVGQVITQALVENMPLNGRKFQDLSLLVPGTRSANYYDPTKTEVGGVSYGGLSGRSVNITVDGADNNDGVVRGLLQQFSADAIQEYKVTTARYGADQGRSTGGLVNVITKSGTNDLHGSAYVFGRNEKLNSETYFEQQAGTGKQPFSQAQPGGTVGGPIARDKAFYFFSYEYNHRNDYATIFTNDVLPAEQGAAPKPFRDHLVTAKTDFNLGQSNRFLVRYALEDQKRLHDFIGGNTLASSGATNTNMIHSVVAKDSMVLGNHLNEFTFVFQNFENNITADQPSVPGITTPDFTYGANLNTPQQTIQRRVQLRDDYSFRKDFHGDHNFKAGGELIRSHFGGFFTPTLYGLFTFANRLPGSGGDVNAYLNAIADSFSGSAGTTSFNDNWTYVAGYFQDDWKPSGNVTLNLGLRWEAQTGPYKNNLDTAPLRALAAAGSPSTKSQDWNNFGPRLGFAWDVFRDGHTVVRGGYGIYYDEIFQNVTLYEYWSSVTQPVNFLSLSPPPFTAAQYAANRDAIRSALVDPTFSGQRVFLLAPNLKQPYSHSFNAGVSRQFSANASVDVDYIRQLGRDEISRWWVNTAENQNTTVSPAGIFAPGLGQFRVEGNRDHSRVDALMITGKLRRGPTQVISTYTLSKAMNTSNDFNASPNDLTNLNWEQDWGPAPNDVRHRFTLGAVLDLSRGFQVSSSVQANTGKPYNPVQGFGGYRVAVRPIDPSSGQPFERNAFYGPGFFTWDMRAAKKFDLGQHRSVEVLFEVFNLTNRVNLSGDTGFGFNNVYGTGTTPSPGFGTATQIVPNSNRQAEFGARFRF
jgi:outer membrane receptor protein involved in Fe transport